MVEQNPESIHEIATLDKNLADKIISQGFKESHGITTYDDFVEAVKKASEKTSEGGTELAKRIEAVEADLEAEKLEKSLAYVESFKSAHADFKDELEQEVWNLFDKSELTLEEAYDYVKAKAVATEKSSEAEAKAYEAIEKKNLASSFGSSKSVAQTDTKKPVVNNATKNFLDAIGAKKTLAKHN